VPRARARSADGGERGARDGSGGRRSGQAGHAAALRRGRLRKRKRERGREKHGRGRHLVAKLGRVFLSPEMHRQRRSAAAARAPWCGNGGRALGLSAMGGGVARPRA